MGKIVDATAVDSTGFPFLFSISLFTHWSIYLNSQLQWFPIVGLVCQGLYSEDVVPVWNVVFLWSSQTIHIAYEVLFFFPQGFKICTTHNAVC